MAGPTPDPFCREASLSVGESLLGSAVDSTWAWILLEYEGPWGRGATDDLPGGWGEALDALEAAVPGSRIQLVRRGTGGTEPGPSLVLASTRPGATWVRRFHVAELDALRALDVPALFAGPEPTVGERVPHPVLLVCTHGRRDRCCAKFGLVVHRALEDLGTVEVWQTTHLGGHRFAPTLLQLPDGICYGRVEVEEVPALAAAVVAGEIFHLDRVRGRTALTARDQVAEVFVRRQTGSRAVALDPDLVARMAEVEVVKLPTQLERPPSCHKAAEAVVRLVVRPPAG